MRIVRWLVWIVYRLISEAESTCKHYIGKCSTKKKSNFSPMRIDRWLGWIVYRLISEAESTCKHYIGK